MVNMCMYYTPLSFIHINMKNTLSSTHREQLTGPQWKSRAMTGR